MQEASPFRYPVPVTTRRGARASTIPALRNILAMETDGGFPDKAVSGGLDKFLATLRREADADPALTPLDERGLLSVRYAELDAAQRERWAREVRRFLDEPSSAPSAPSAPAASGNPVERSPDAPPSGEGNGARAPSEERGPLDAPLGSLRSVNRPQAAAIRRTLLKRGALAGEGEPSVRDLLYFFPLRHIDYTEQRTVAQLRVGEHQTLTATLWEAYEARVGRGGRIRATHATVGDDTGNLRVIWWGNPWIAQHLNRAIAEAAQTAVNGAPRVALSGKVTLFRGKRQMESPEWEIVGAEPSPGVHTGGLVPVYPSVGTAKGRRIPPRRMREAVREALDSVKPQGIPDPLPDAARRPAALLSLGQAIEQAHYPDSEPAKEQARRRLAFDELLAIQLKLAMERDYADKQTGPALAPFPPLAQSFIASLPFELTEGQRAALREAMADAAGGGRPMSRLLQGDVGSGKTVVAAAMLLTAVAAGYQGAMMAPTEVLAEQHFLNLRLLLQGREHALGNLNWFAVPLDGRAEPVTVGLLTGSTRAAPRRELLRMASEGALDLLIGTHALIQRGVDLPNLALAVGDEQHRFGVLQRDALRGKSAVGEPHLLLMSATPIPRSLALTLYGGLEISTIRELPKGRQEIVTRVVDAARASDAEGYLVEQVRAGRQCFIVYPRIDDADDAGDDDPDDPGDGGGDENSDAAPESAAPPPLAAVPEWERLRATSLASVRVGLLHGRMPLPEKQAVMDEFRAGRIDVLVSTPVIEVGIDVPNATVMMIRSPSRFGLAQLHQLRGRVGRGEHRSYCFLVAESEGAALRRLGEARQRRAAAGADPQEAEQWFKRAVAQAEAGRERLAALARTNDGFEIAEADLRMRGRGDFWGERQSGASPVRMASLDDHDLTEASREQAGVILAADPGLARNPGLRAAVERLSAAITGEMA